MKIKLTAIIMAAMLFLSACGSNGDEEKVKIGLLRIDDSIPFYVAEQEGLFKEMGVEAELISFSSSSDQSLAMEAGELDMAMNDMIVQCLMKKNGTDTKAVALAYGAVSEEGRFLVVAAPQSGIYTSQDLSGKNVGISTNTMMDFLFENFENIYGLPSSEINKVNMPNLSLRLEAVLSGSDLQAAILPDPLAAYAVEKGCSVVIDDTALGVNLSQSVVLTTDEFINANEEQISKILAAYNQAKELLNENPEKYRSLCLEIANVPEELSASYPYPHYTADVLPAEEYVRQVVDWLVSRELINEEYTYEDLVWGDSVE